MWSSYWFDLAVLAILKARGEQETSQMPPPHGNLLLMLAYMAYERGINLGLKSLYKSCIQNVVVILMADIIGIVLTIRVTNATVKIIDYGMHTYIEIITIIT